MNASDASPTATFRLRDMFLSQVQVAGFSNKRLYGTTTVTGWRGVDDAADRWNNHDDLQDHSLDRRNDHLDLHDNGRKGVAKDGGSDRGSSGT